MRNRFDLNMMKKNILSTLIFLLPFAAISCGSGNDGDSRETPAGEDAAAVQVQPQAGKVGVGIPGEGREVRARFVG